MKRSYENSPVREIVELRKKASTPSFAVPLARSFFKAVKKSDMIRILSILSDQKDVISAVDSLGQSCLHWAVRRGNR
jgi:ankyrin repeat protein